MAAIDFDPSLAIILREEGGNDDDPRDHGGRTSRGIIQREWDAYRTTHPDRPEDVWKAPQTDINAIYHDQYWEPYCDSMPPGVDLVFFNTCVNSGRQQAVKELQRALGIEADGMYGMETKAAIVKFDDTKALVGAMCDRRRAFYKALKQYSIYGKGWMARTDRVEKSALAMVAGSPHVVNAHPHVDTIPEDSNVTVSAKAEPQEVSQTMVTPETGGTVTAGSGMLSGVVNELQSQLTPFADTLQWVKYALLLLTVIGIGYTIYTVIQRNKVKQAVG